jgi:hypothetical protein
MDFEIKPYTGAGPIAFGLSVDEVRKILREPVEESDKSSTAIPADFFRSLGIFVYYKEPGICEAVEFGGPESPTFRGQHFLERPYREMEGWIKTLDPEVLLEAAGLTSHKFGIGLYAPSARKEPDRPIEGIIVFDKGYYDH